MKSTKLTLLQRYISQMVENLANSQLFSKNKSSLFQDMIMVPSSIDLLIESCSLKDASPAALSLTRVINIHVDTYGGVEVSSAAFSCRHELKLLERERNSTSYTLTVLLALPILTGDLPTFNRLLGSKSDIRSQL